MNKKFNYLDSQFVSYDLIYRIHATKRMFSRNINESEVVEILRNGAIIEEYPDDYLFPSVLMNGKTRNGKPLHVVAGIDVADKKLFIITVYEPNDSLWGDDFCRRIK